MLKPPASAAGAAAAPNVGSGAGAAPPKAGAAVPAGAATGVAPNTGPPTTPLRSRARCDAAQCGALGGRRGTDGDVGGRAA
eukprot:2527271-Prymnesium_polylepis.1